MPKQGISPCLTCDRAYEAGFQSSDPLNPQLLGLQYVNLPSKLILPFIKKAVEEVLETYPHHLAPQALANPNMRQALIAYVLNRVSGYYELVDEDKKQQELYSDLFKRCLEQTSHFERTIHQGIVAVLREYAKQVIRQIPEEVDPTAPPSDWFG